MITVVREVQWHPFRKYLCPGQCQRGLLGWSIPVANLVPGWGTYLGCGFDPSLVREATHRRFSLTSVFLSLPSSVSERNEKMSLGEVKEMFL